MLNMRDNRNITIKASIDEGITWPGKYQVEINENEGYGYSCMAFIDERTIGILYEGTGDLYFQKIAINDILDFK